MVEGLFGLALALLQPAQPIHVPGWSSTPAPAKRARHRGPAVPSVIFDVACEPGRGERTLELSVSACGRARCPLAVRLRGRAAIGRPVVFGWPVPRGAFRPGYASESWGVEDALRPGRPAIRGFSFGGGAAMAMIAARAVALTPSLYGMLVHEATPARGGRRRHHLVVAGGGGAALAWTAEEPADTTMTVALGDASDGTHRIMVHEKPAAGAALPSRLSVTVWRWNGTTAALERVP